MLEEIVLDEIALTDFPEFDELDESNIDSELLARVYEMLSPQWGIGRA